MKQYAPEAGFRRFGDDFFRHHIGYFGSGRRYARAGLAAISSFSGICFLSLKGQYLRHYHRRG